MKEAQIDPWQDSFKPKRRRALKKQVVRHERHAAKRDPENAPTRRRYKNYSS